MTDKALGQQLSESQDRINDLHEDWFDILSAELIEGGSGPRTAVNLLHGLDAIQRKIDEIRADLADLETAK
jgi:hypothetical protein